MNRDSYRCVLRTYEFLNSLIYPAKCSFFKIIFNYYIFIKKYATDIVVSFHILIMTIQSSHVDCI